MNLIIKLELTGRSTTNIIYTTINKLGLTKRGVCMFTEEELKGIIELLENKDAVKFDLDNDDLPGAYYYTCLPLCLLDAIYSIGALYTSTVNVVKRYCDRYGIKPYSECGGASAEDHNISELIKNISKEGVESFAGRVVKNRQRTSSTNGILKAQAVLECAKVLQEYGIETKSDFQEKLNGEVEEEFKKVKGQNSGVSLDYLKMLCGDEDTFKEDRQILCFLKEHSNQKLGCNGAKPLMDAILGKLKENGRHPNLNMRRLDYVIWNYQKDKKSK